MNQQNVIIEGFERFYFFKNGCGHHVYKLGQTYQPSVLLIQELPGILPETIELARRLHRDGFCVYMPHLFGAVGVDGGESLKNTVKVCVSREFKALAGREKRPITDWLRALARSIRDESKAPIAAIGMCYSGSFALALMMDDAVVAPVMSQPANFSVGFKDKAVQNLGISDDEVKEAVARSKKDKIPVLGMRFSHDVLCPRARFDYLESLLGDNFRRFEINSFLFNRHGIRITAHSVLTVDYVDEPAHPTYQAYHRMVNFINERLGERPQMDDYEDEELIAY